MRGEIRALQEELAQRLIQIAEKTDDPRACAGFLVRGFPLKTDFGGVWCTEFPDSEVDHRSIMTALDSLTLMMPSAFRLFDTLAGDYVAAIPLPERAPKASPRTG